MTTLKAVVFDIGNVLVEWDPFPFFDKRIGRLRREALFAAVDLPGMNERVDLGAPFSETVRAMAEAHPDWHAEVMLWHDHWIEMCQPEIPHSVRLLRALKARGVPVYSLSNFGIETYELACMHYPFLNEFDADFISGYLEVMKPDPRIYEWLERKTGVEPSTLLFADDRADNVAAARARGWTAHLFETPQGWADTLVAHGFLTPQEAR